MTAYNAQYYKSLKSSSLRSAEEIIPDIIKLINPKSVLDLGCGIGTWLSVFKYHGVENVRGIDGSYIQNNQLLIEENEFQATDLSKHFPSPMKVDLAFSLEVAEHLGIENADKVVDFLCECSDCILFGAAIPLQGGTDHFNEQWQSYWVMKFEERGYICSPYLRNLHWNNKSVAIWYRQNTLLFVRSDSALANKIIKLDIRQLYNIVHPDLYTLKVKRYHFLDEVIARFRKIVFAIQSKFC